MNLKAACHDGTCHQCTGEGTVITIEANPLPVSLCPACLARMIPADRGMYHRNDATGIRSAIVKRWREIKRREREARGKRLAELERRAREDVERVARMDDGNGRGV